MNKQPTVQDQILAYLMLQNVREMGREGGVKRVGGIVYGEKEDGSELFIDLYSPQYMDKIQGKWCRVYEEQFWMLPPWIETELIREHQKLITSEMTFRAGTAKDKMIQGGFWVPVRNFGILMNVLPPTETRALPQHKLFAIMRWYKEEAIATPPPPADQPQTDLDDKKSDEALDKVAKPLARSVWDGMEFKSAAAMADELIGIVENSQEFTITLDRAPLIGYANGLIPEKASDKEIAGVVLEICRIAVAKQLKAKLDAQKQVR